MINRLKEKIFVLKCIFVPGPALRTQHYDTKSANPQLRHY